MEMTTVNSTRILVLTIGHSNHEAATFLTLLREHGVNVVVDVRSAPYSRYLPHFNKEHLEETLQEAGIGYAFLGKELGGQPAERTYYDADGRIMYDALAETAAFSKGIGFLLDTVSVHPSTGSGRRRILPRTRCSVAKRYGDERLLRGASL